MSKVTTPTGKEVDSPIEIWHAEGAIDKPWCVTGQDDGGITMNVYVDEEGAITGVLVYEDFRLAAAAGTISAAVLAEEVEYEGSVDF